MKKLCFLMRMVLIVTMALFFVSDDLSGANPTEYQSLLPDFKNLPMAKVEKIIDGDTVSLSVFNDKNCRLAGVNTPIKEGEYYSKEAQDFLINLLTNESVWVEEIPANDVYDRHLVCLYRVPDGLFVNLEVVRQGYGKVFMEGNLKTGMPQVFNDYQEIAKLAEKGVWKSPPPVVEVWITKSGKKYHTEKCRYAGQIKVTLDEAKRKGLEPCSICKPPA